MNVNRNSNFLVTVETRRKRRFFIADAVMVETRWERRTFIADVVDIVPRGDTTEYRLQNLNQNFDRRFTAAELYSHMRGGGLQLLTC